MAKKQVSNEDILNAINNLGQRVDALEKEQTTTVKSSKKDKKNAERNDKDLLPYGSKPKILKDLKISELKEIIPKSDYMDKGFNLTYKDMVFIFEEHGLGGRPWITAQEQIDYFILPLKKEYKITGKKWEKKVRMMTDETKTKLITAETKEKSEGKKWTEKQLKANGYKVANLQNILKSISEIKS